MGKRTHRRVLADNASKNNVRSRQSSMTARDLSETTSSDDLFSMLDVEAPEVEDDDIYAKAFIGRLMGTYVFPDFITPYAESRGKQYDLILKLIKDMYGMFVMDGGWTVSKFFECILFIIKTNENINRFSFMKVSERYDSRGLPAGILVGVSSDDYQTITNDAMETKNSRRNA